MGKIKKEKRKKMQMYRKQPLQRKTAGAPLPLSSTGARQATQDAASDSAAGRSMRFSQPRSESERKERARRVRKLLMIKRATALPFSRTLSRKECARVLCSLS